MQTLPPFKRGDTFSLGCLAKDAGGVPEDLSNITLRAQIRRQGTRLAPEPVFVAELTVDKANQSTHKGEFSLTALPAVTKLWQSGLEATPVMHVVDIQKDVAGVVISSETFAVPVIKDVTYDD
jgi:hypothetical protein